MSDDVTRVPRARPVAIFRLGDERFEPVHPAGTLALCLCAATAAN